MKNPRRTRAPKTSSRRKRPARLAHGATKESLLDAAERLFAEYGMRGVSLRMINAAAGARNASAAHYHFRSRESLFRAVTRRRMDKLSEERLALLNNVERAAQGGVPDLYGIVEAHRSLRVRELVPLGHRLDLRRLRVRYADPGRGPCLREPLRRTFFGRYVAGDERWAPLLGSEPQGVVYVADP